MVVVTKGNIQLYISIENKIDITPSVSIAELHYSAKAIAYSLKPILKYQLASNPGKDKEDVIRTYFKNNGWQVEK